ncbi:MAG: PriCT-2 domain-containing protein, partial [Kiritimatiellae bacterium]|nr:PriCT-2 domain-containing protein [Kiritimatiellia bacterium]
MILIELPKEACLSPDWWRSSPPVPFVPREEVTPAPTERPEGLWVDALLAIPNGLNDSASMGYDEWFRVICGIHAETGGSPEGLALAQDWSARSPKHDPAFLEQRVWPYIKG